MEKIHVGCHQCDAQLRVSTEHRGRRVRCPRCREPILIPESDEDLEQLTAYDEDDDWEDEAVPRTGPPAVPKGFSRRRRRRGVQGTYEPQRGTTLILTVLVIISILLMVMVEVATIYRILLCRLFLNGADHLFPAMELSDSFVTIPVFLYLINVFFIVIVFLIWMFHAHRNAEAISGDDLGVGRGWAIGSWFIPFANIVVPCISMLQIVKASNRGEPTRLSYLVGWWWAFWILRMIGGQVAQVLANEMETLEAVIYSDTFRAVAFFPELLGTVLFLWLFRSVDALQEKNAS